MSNIMEGTSTANTGDKFPWELLKAECLRLVCVQLVEASSEGQKSFKPARKEDMVAFLRDVHERGVIEAFEDVERKIITVEQASPSKRKSVHVAEEEEDEDEEDEDEYVGDDSDNKRDGGEAQYNTRYKGVKRVRVHGFSPEPVEPKPKRKVGRPRKSIPAEGDVVAVEGRRKRGRPRTSGVGGVEQIKVSKGKGKSLENGDVLGEVVVPKRRGRPRKVVTESNASPEKKPLQSANAPVSKDSAREVFDGIVLVKRNASRTEDAVGDNDVGKAANDERNGSEDAVIAAVNGDDALGDLSSLGGSNKARFGLENEHISATYTPDPEEEGHDIDADGEFEADAEVIATG